MVASSYKRICEGGLPRIARLVARRTFGKSIFCVASVGQIGVELRTSSRPVLLCRRDSVVVLHVRPAPRSTYNPVFTCIDRPTYRCIALSICLPLCLSCILYLSVYTPTYLCICVYIYICIYVYTCPSFFSFQPASESTRRCMSIRVC